jgi:dUTP pyrophosphatase
MQIKFKKLYKDALAPTRGSEHAAGWDLYSHSFEEYKEGRIKWRTGIAVEIPKGYVGLLFPRSSIHKQDVIQSNSVGVIDSDYRGQIFIPYKADPVYILEHLSQKRPMNTFGVKERIGQIIVIPYPKIEFVEVDELSETVRGEGGFGSTGQ